MKHLNHLTSTAFTMVIASLLLTFVACHNSGRNNSSGISSDSLNMEAEDIIRTVAVTGDVDRTFQLADSFMDLGRLSPIKADFFKAVAYGNQGDMDTHCEYLKKIIEACDKTGEEPKVYSQVVIALSNYYQSNDKYEEALQVVLPATTKFEATPAITSDRKGNLYYVIGSCQINLNQFVQGEESYEKAYQYYKKYQDECTDLEHYTYCINGVSNMLANFNSISTLNELQEWIARCDSLLAWYRIQPGADQKFVDNMDGQLLLKRAENLILLDKKTEAAKVFEQFQQTDFSHTDVARLNSCVYLSSVGRYAEAADIYQDFDRMAAEWGLDYNLDVISGYLFAKFHHNYYAGRKDSALAVAVQIDSLIDKAVNEQKNNAALELATIYETQQKEAQIARQQATLSQQRVVGLVIAIALLTLFFIIYTLVRRRAARRLAEMRSAKERIENELKIARDIQMSMVPSIFPDYEGLDMYASMTPAKEVGGDLYGYVLNGDHLYFAVGDVSGKGVPASLFMAQATRLFRTLAAQQMMPAEICTRMNEALSGEDNESGMFVTFFLGLLNLSTGHLDFCNAGHNPPVFSDGDTGGDFLQMLPNAPIGLWPGLEYEGEQVDSVKGRLLFIYTDGLNEAENGEQQQFGDDRLLDILRHTHFDSAQQVVETLKAEVEKHRNGAEANDDLTMMCVRLM